MRRKEVRCMKDNNLLSHDVKKVVIYDEEQQKEVAVITKELITTANENIVVKVIFND